MGELYKRMNKSLRSTLQSKQIKIVKLQVQENTQGLTYDGNLFLLTTREKFTGMGIFHEKEPGRFDFPTLLGLYWIQRLAEPS